MSMGSSIKKWERREQMHTFTFCVHNPEETSSLKLYSQINTHVK